MANYASSPSIFALAPGDTLTVFNAEQPAVPQQSIAAAIVKKQGQEDTAIGLEIQFSAAPGVFEVDLMEATTDTANAYQIANGGNAKITAVDANNRARIDVTNFVGRFAAVKLASRANAVNFTAILNR